LDGEVNNIKITTPVDLVLAGISSSQLFLNTFTGKGKPVHVTMS